MGCRWLGFRRAGGLGRLSGQQLEVARFSTQDNPPGNNDAAMRSEGVGILVDKKATAAWRRGGEVWEAVSSRMVMARLKWIGRGQRRRGGSRETSDISVSVLSVCTHSPGYSWCQG